MIKTYWLPSQSHSWLLFDEERGAVFVLSLANRNWRLGLYNGHYLPSERNRVSAEVERALASVVGLGDNLSPADLVQLGAMVWSLKRQSLAG